MNNPNKTIICPECGKEIDINDKVLDIIKREELQKESVLVEEKLQKCMIELEKNNSVIKKLQESLDKKVSKAKLDNLIKTLESEKVCLKNKELELDNLKQKTSENNSSIIDNLEQEIMFHMQNIKELYREIHYSEDKICLYNRNLECMHSTNDLLNKEIAKIQLYLDETNKRIEELSI